MIESELVFLLGKWSFLPFLRHYFATPGILFTEEFYDFLLEFTEERRDLLEELDENGLSLDSGLASFFAEQLFRFMRMPVVAPAGRAPAGVAAAITTFCPLLIVVSFVSAGSSVIISITSLFLSRLYRSGGVLDGSAMATRSGSFPAR